MKDIISGTTEKLTVNEIENRTENVILEILMDDVDFDRIENMERIYKGSLIFFNGNTMYKNNEIKDRYSIDELRKTIFQELSNTLSKLDSIIMDQNRALDVIQSQHEVFNLEKEEIKKTRVKRTLNQQLKRLRLDYITVLVLFVINAKVAFLDAQIFSWDPAFYAERSIELSKSLNIFNPKESAQALMGAIAHKPPLLVWVSSLVYLLSRNFSENINFPFLMTIVLFSTFSNVLIIMIIRKIVAKNKTIFSLITIALINSSLMYISMSRNFYVEIMQIFVILVTILFFLIFKQQTILARIFMIIISLTLTILVKIPTIILTAPILIILVSKLLLSIYRRKTKYFLPSDIIFAIVATSLLVLSSMWYMKNIGISYNFAKSVSSGEYSLYYGRDSGLISKSKLWFDYIIQGLTIHTRFNIGILIAILGLSLFLINLLVKRKFKEITNYKNELLFMSIILLYGTSLTIQINEEIRYITPLIPLIIIIFILVIEKVIKALKTDLIINPILILITLGAMYLLVDTNTIINGEQGINREVPYLSKVKIQSTNSSELKELDKYICKPEKKALFAVDFIDLNYNTLNYYSTALNERSNATCDYVYLGFLKERTEALDVINKYYFVVSDSRLENTSFVPQPYFTNTLSRDILQYLNSNREWFKKRFRNSTIIVFVRKV